MEILEMQDPEKRRLMDEAKKHKEAITSDVQAVTERTETIIKNALIIGGALALTYFVVSSLTGGKSKKKKSKAIKLVAQTPQTATSNDEEEDESNSLLSEIGTKIANEATVFLLNLAKEKLTEYLQSGKGTQHEDH